MRLRVLFLLLVMLPAAVFAAQATTQVTKGVNDKCLDTKISLNQQTGKVEQVNGDKNSTQYKICTTVSGGCNWDKEKAKICMCGKVTFTDSAGKPFKTPISKCDPDAQKKIQDAYSSASGLKDFALRQAASQALATDINIGTPQGNSQISQGLQNLGATKAEADAAVAQDPQKAYDVLQKMVTGDTSGAKQAAQELGLNSNVSNNISSLQPKDFPDALKGAVSSANQQQLSNILSSPVTGFPYSADQSVNTIPNIAEKVGGMCDQIPGGCGNACNVKNTLTCQTNNPGAIVDSASTRAYGCVACGARNNTACCPSMEAGVAAMAELLTGPGYFGGSNNTLYSAICKYAPTSDGNNCVAYSNYVAQQMGVSPYATLDPQNTTQMAQVMMAMAKYEHGNGVPFTLDQLQAGLEAKYGVGNLPAGDPNFASRLVAGGAQPNGYYSPFALGYGGTPAGSFFTPTSVGTPTGGVSALPTTATPVSSTLLSTSTPVAPAQLVPQPVATLVVQPPVVSSGGSVVISWSSVGISPSQSCLVTLATSTPAYLLGTGTQGSKTIQPKTIGFWQVVLQCTGLDGTQLVRQATLQVK